MRQREAEVSLPQCAVELTALQTDREVSPQAQVRI